MSSTGVRDSNSTEKRVIKGLILNEAQFIQSLRVFANTSTLSGLGSTGTETNNSPLEASGNYLAKSGDIMLGQLGNAFDSIAATNILSDILDVSKATGTTFPIVILQGESPPTADDLVTITQGEDVFPFQELVIRTRSSVITIKNSDNINTPDGNDLVLPVGSIIHLYFDTFLGEWVIDGGTPFFGGGAGTTLPVVDTTSIVKGSVDDTKQMRFEVDGFDTATIRVMTLPNADVTLAGLEVTSQTWTGSNLFLNATFRDGLFFLQDTDDITRQLKFDLGAITPGQTRTLTVPDSSTTIAGLGVVIQQWTGSNDFVGAVTVRDSLFIVNQTDITKQMTFDLSGATTGQVLILKSNHTGNRTLTFPDTTTDLAGLGTLSQTWTGTNIFAGITAIHDTDFFIQDGADITKQLNFALEGGVTGFVLVLASVITGNRTLTFPDTTTMLAGLGTLSQTWTGTNIFAGITAIHDTDFFIQDGADITKQLNFALEGGVTGFVLTLASVITGNRTLTFPDSTTTLAGLGVVSQSWTGSNLFLNATFRDGLFFLQDTDDITRQLKFDLGAITPGQTRTLTVPDSSTTIAGLGVVSQSWTGTNIFVGITNIRTDNNFVMQDPTDPTKQVIWDLSAISASTTRTITMPDNDVTLGAGGGTGNEITEGNSFVRVTDPGTGTINFEVDGAGLGSITTGLGWVLENDLTLASGDLTLSSGDIILGNGFEIVNTSSNTTTFAIPDNEFISITESGAIRILIGDDILLSCDNNADILFQEGGVTVGRYDGGANEWQFDQPVRFNGGINGDIIPTINGVSPLGTSTLNFSSLFLSTTLQFGNTVRQITTSGNNLLIRTSSGNDIIFREDITEFFRCDGGTNEIIFERDVMINDDIEMNGALNHDGTTFGLYGVTPVTRQTFESLTGGENLGQVIGDINSILAILDATGILELV